MTSNTQLLDIITDMEEKLQGHQLFGMSYVRLQRHPGGFSRFPDGQKPGCAFRPPLSHALSGPGGIHQKIKTELEEKKEITAPALVLPYSGITSDMTDWVGGKSAHLGEMHNRLHLPIPRGFAITTSGL